MIEFEINLSARDIETGKPIYNETAFDCKAKIFEEGRYKLLAYSSVCLCLAG